MGVKTMYYRLSDRKFYVIPLHLYKIELKLNSYNEVSEKKTLVLSFPYVNSN